MIDNMISDNDLKEIVEHISKDSRYGTDNSLGSQALRQCPMNNDNAIIAMKIAIIDMENSTQLSRLLGHKKGRSLNLIDIVNKIQSIPFDARVESGDRTLVSELSKWSSEKGLNLFSFFSKYCTYHNYDIYDKDDYSIYDNVVKERIGDYLTVDDCRFLFGDNIKIRKGQTISSFVCNRIEEMRKSCDYESYCNVIDYVLDKHNITRDKKRRELDSYIWYKNR